MRNSAILFGLIVASGLIAVRLYSVQASEPDTDLPKQLVDELLGKLRADDIDGVFALCKAHTILPESESAIMDDVAKQCKLSRPVIIAKYGKPLGELELVRTEMLCKSLVRFVYLEKFERFGIVWQFDFYRGQAKWWIPQVSYFDNPLDQYAQLPGPAR